MFPSPSFQATTTPLNITEEEAVEDKIRNFAIV